MVVAHCMNRIKGKSENVMQSAMWIAEFRKLWEVSKHPRTVVDHIRANCISDRLCPFMMPLLCSCPLTI
jgi:hypothetical protein